MHTHEVIVAHHLSIPLRNKIKQQDRLVQGMKASPAGSGRRARRGGRVPGQRSTQLANSSAMKEGPAGWSLQGCPVDGPFAWLSCCRPRLQRGEGEQGQLQEPLAGVETGAFAALSVDMLSMATLFSSVLYSSH